MGLLETLSAGQDVKRLRDIASILIRYGFDDLVDRMGFKKPFSNLAAKDEQRRALERRALTTPERACAALQELGPTFIKLGQILATRVDIFAPEWIDEFEKLHNDVGPVPYESIRPELEHTFGAAVEEVLDDFDQLPLAVGSIAQVYRATLNGKAIIVKVQKPGIRKSIESDLRLMSALASWLDSEVKSFARYAPKKIFQQFSSALRKELDFTRESHAADRIRNSLQEIPYIVVPEVIWQYTNATVCVQEYIDGKSITSLEKEDYLGFDRQQLAKNGVEAFVKMALEDGFFHADPHPGNLLFLPEDKIALIDFGLVGSLSELRRSQLALLIYGAAENDSNPVVDVMLDWAGPEARIDIEELSVDVEALLNEYQGIALSQVDVSRVLIQLTDLARSYQLAMPADLSLLIKSVLVLEALALRIDPQFDLIGEAQPFVKNAILRRYSPQSIYQRGLQSVTELASVLVDLPRDIRRLIMAIRRGSVPIDINFEQLDTFGHRLERSINRAVIGIVVAALIVGSSIVMTVDSGNQSMGVSIFGFLGFIFASVAGVWLLFSMWRWRK